MVYLGSAARLRTHFGLPARDQLPEDSLKLAGFPYVDTGKGTLGKDSGYPVMKAVRTQVPESTKSHQGTNVAKTGPLRK